MNRERLLERLCDRLLAPARDVQSEQAAQRDPERQLAGPVVGLERLPLDERFARRHRLLDHRLRHARDVFAMERRQHQHPEVAVIGAVDVQHPVAEQRPQIRKPALAPRERVEVADQDLVVDLGADRPHDRLVQQPNREHRTEPPLVLEQQPQRVGDDPARVREARGRAPRGERRPAADAPFAAHVVDDALHQPHLHRRRRRRADLARRGEDLDVGHRSVRYRAGGGRPSVSSGGRRPPAPGRSSTRGARRWPALPERRGPCSAAARRWARRQPRTPTR